MFSSTERGDVAIFGLALCLVIGASLLLYVKMRGVVIVKDIVMFSVIVGYGALISALLAFTELSTNMIGNIAQAGLMGVMVGLVLGKNYIKPFGVFLHRPIEHKETK